jgi:hypothetical protein
VEDLSRKEAAMEVQGWLDRLYELPDYEEWWNPLPEAGRLILLGEGDDGSNWELGKGLTGDQHGLIAQGLRSLAIVDRLATFLEEVTLHFDELEELYSEVSRVIPPPLMTRRYSKHFLPNLFRHD